MSNNKIPEKNEATETKPVEKKEWIVNCPKCSTALYVREGNYAHLCPVCSHVFRTRISEKREKDVTRKTMVEAYVNIDKNEKGELKTDSLIAKLDD